MTFRILQGGVIRYPLNATTSGIGATWSAGQIVELDPTTGKVVDGTGAKVSSGSFRVNGLAVEDEKACAASGKVSILLSAAVVQSDQLASDATFVPGDLVYMNAAGLLTPDKTVTKVFGQAMTDAVASDGDTLTFLYSPVLS